MEPSNSVDTNALDPAVIINTFINDDYREDSVSDDVIAKIHSEPIGQLLQASIMNDLLLEQQLGSYLSAILCAFSTKLNTKVREIVYKLIIARLSEGKFCESEAKRVLEYMSLYAHQLTDSECYQIISKVLGSKTKWVLQKNNHMGLRDFAGILEFLCRMCERAESTVRRKCHAAILNYHTAKWPACVTVMLASAATEISSTSSECSATLQHIRQRLRWQGQKNVIPPSLERGDYVEPDELPVLIFHAVSLLKKPGGEPLRSSIMDMLIIFVDTILNDCEEVNINASRSSSSSSSSMTTAYNRTNFRASSVLGTIVHHLSLLLAKDQGIVMEILTRIKDVDLGITSSEPSISQGVILIALLAARVPRQTTKVLGALCDSISRISTAHLRFQKDKILVKVPQDVVTMIVPLTLSQIQFSLSKFSKSPLLTEQLSPPLVGLALALVDTASTSFAPQKSSHWSVLIPKIQAIKSDKSRITEESSMIGIYLLVDVFIRCEHARVAIVRELTMRVLTGASASSISRTAILTLAILVKKCSHGFRLVEIDLQEVFMGLIELPTDQAGALVLALGPLFENCTALRDRCWLAARKAAFSRDTHHRQGAIVSLCSLLQLSLQKNNLRGHDGNASDSVSEIAEAFSLLRRGVQHQSSVRVLLYDRLFRLQKEYSKLREPVLTLLFDHLRSLTRETEDGSLPLMEEIDSLRPDGDYNDVAANYEIIFDIAVCSSSGEIEPFHSLLFGIINISKVILSDISENTENKKNAMDACKFVWDLSRAHAALFDEQLGLNDIDDANILTITQKKNVITLQKIAQACAVAVVTLPTDLIGIGNVLHNKVRFDVATELINKEYNFGNMLRKSAKEEVAKRKKTKKLDENEIPVESSSSTFPNQDINDKTASNEMEIEVYLKYSIFMLSQLYLGGDTQDPSQVQNYDDNGDIGVNLDERSRLLITRSALENALRALDRLLTILHTKSASKEVETLAGTLGLIISTSSLEKNFVLLKDIACCLFRFLIVLDSNEPTKEALRMGSSGSLSQFEQGQLALRCLLGCVRVTLMTSSDTDGDNSAQEKVYQLLGPAYQLASKMKKTQDRIELNTTLTSLTATQMDPTKGLKNILKGFMTLLKRFLKGSDSPDAKENKRLSSLSNDRLCVFLPLIMEITAIAGDDNCESMSLKIPELCNEDLDLPSDAVVERITNLLILVPGSASQRLEAAYNAAQRISICAAICDDNDVNMDENDCSTGGIEEYQRMEISSRSGDYLSLSTLPSAINAIIVILEIAINDAEFVHRLREQRFCSSALKRRKEHMNREMDLIESSSGDEETSAGRSLRKSSEEEEERAAHARDKVDNILYNIVSQLLHCVTPLLTIRAGSSCDRLLSFLVKVFRLEARLAKDRIFLSEDGLPNKFTFMAKASRDIREKVSELIQHVHDKVNTSDESGQPGGKRKKYPTSSNRQEKIVPELVFQMEQRDTQLIAIGNANKKVNIRDLLTHTTLRDFKFELANEENASPNQSKRTKA